MSEPGPEPAARGGYFEELHVALVVALVVICVTLGIVGWELHPDSNGFQPVPQGLRILIAGSGFAATQTLTQAGNEGATLKVTAIYTQGVVPLVDSAAYTLLSGPQAAGAASIERGPVVMFDGKPLPSTRWGYIVLNPGSARPCAAHSRYRYGTVAYPMQASTPALVVPPLPTETSVGDTLPPPGLCLHWDTGSPFTLSGPYLSVRFPPLRGISSAIPFTEIPQDSDLGVATVTRTLSLEEGNNTANFAIQTDPHPTIAAPTSWTWVIKDTPQVIQVAATNSSAAQHENNDAFYSGVLFGVVGGALIALITELVVPLRHRRLRGHRP
ncbi:MAG: hypothetical protein WAL61_00075 [Acidimicrobiales bacterium]